MEGGLDPIGEEFGNFYSYPFENLTFCSGTPGNVAGYSQFNWPVSQWATDLKINVTKTLALRVDAFCIGYLGGSPHLLPKPPSVRRSL